MINETNHQGLPNANPQGSDDEMLDTLQRETFAYFLKEINKKNGLVADSTTPGSPASIAVVGMAITCYIAAAERGLFSKVDARKRILTILNFFHSSHQHDGVDATGYKGFYYHFLDMNTGKRAWKSELSTIDTAIFMAGVLTAVNYFVDENEHENEIRRIGNELYRRVDWQWALDGGDTITHGWNPESGFITYRWDQGYNEAHILYILALGSPTFPIEAAGYKKWISTFKWLTSYGQSFLYAGPLFIHQMSQLWLDFRNIKDDRNRASNVTYFENSRRATLVQQMYAIDNPLGFAHYGEFGWGFTASNGPGPGSLKVDGIKRTFYGYMARGVPNDPDDGTIAPWAVTASLPFASDVVLKTLRHAIERLDLKKHSKYGFDASFNPTYPEKGPNPNGWISPWQYGLNQGPIILMIENYKSGLIWEIMRKSRDITNGLQRAGFRGDWLGG